MGISAPPRLSPFSTRWTVSRTTPKAPPRPVRMVGISRLAASLRGDRRGRFRRWSPGNGEDASSARRPSPDRGTRRRSRVRSRCSWSIARPSARRFRCRPGTAPSRHPSMLRTSRSALFAPFWSCTGPSPVPWMINRESIEERRNFMESEEVNGPREPGHTPDSQWTTPPR